MNKLNSMTSVAALLALSVAGATQVTVAATNTTTEMHATKATDGKCGEAKCGANKMKKHEKSAEAKCGADKKAADGKCGATKKAADGKCGADKKVADGKCGAK
ncbi:HvfA family oxazolone/thioamide-modified RiPP metallophore [Acinetobacter oleivorans]|uniref:HvfA family oxazolone/thioamide-modified RiPP metallophore n=1 Tax=Acinetobacter oleivorans TaxID=1148157 RepID=UPI001580FBB3|nr:hypothetical protein [Acinetobacter oleivorans]NUF11928.1 hypothetical protein [Acinetobacter oleivorans]